MTEEPGVLLQIPTRGGVEQEAGLGGRLWPGAPRSRGLFRCPEVDVGGERESFIQSMGSFCSLCLC